MARITVIGAGITGVTTAYALLERGHDVSVIDRLRYPAMETSFANGGQLSASNAEVWNSLGTILKGLRWMLRADAPLLVNPRPSWHKYSWMAEFCAQLLNYRANTIETTRLAIAARAHLYRIADKEKIAFDLERRGILHLYYDEKSFDKAVHANRLLREGGLDRFEVTPAEIARIEPALQGHFHGGLHTPSDSTGDIHKFTNGLAAACERRGARFLFNRAVKSFDHDRNGLRVALQEAAASGQPASDVIQSDAVVICAGVASRHLAGMLGDRINIYPVKGYSITVCLDEGQSQAAAPWVSLLDEDAKIVTSRLGTDRFRVAGTAEFNGANHDIRADRIAPLVSWSQRLFPMMSTRTIIPWAGLRPMTPTMLPRVTPGKRRGVFYNTGHGHLGWTLSAATADLIAEQIHLEFEGK